jgi:hypothetical protein
MVKLPEEIFEEFLKDEFFEAYENGKKKNTVESKTTDIFIP